MRSPVKRGAAVMLVALSAVANSASHHADAADTHFADAADASLAAIGKSVYAGYCASCHGKNLQGQPLWQLNDEFSGRRAPAHDETGHTWQHADEGLFQKTKYGRFPEEPADARSSMPGFAAVLDDHQILAALAFIKARWPLGLRISQAMLNPGFIGMPSDASDIDWRLPPSCMALVRRQGTGLAR